MEEPKLLKMTRENFVKKYHPNWTPDMVDCVYFNNEWYDKCHMLRDFSTVESTITRFELFACMPMWWINQQYNIEWRADETIGSYFDWLALEITEEYAEKFLHPLKTNENFAIL